MSMWIELLIIAFVVAAGGALALCVQLAVEELRDTARESAERERRERQDEDAQAWERFDEGVMRSLQGHWSKLP